MGPPKGRDFWCRRHAIRRAAATDARHRIPMPSMDRAVTTPFRELLWTQRDRQLVAIHAELIELVAGAETVAAAAAVVVGTLEEQLGATRNAIEATNHDAINISLRRFGDGAASEDLVAARRRRERARAIQQLEDRCDRLRLALAEQQGIQATELARISEIGRGKAARATAIHLAAIVRCGLYDQVLLRRHPERQLVAHCLEMTPRPLPSWVLAYADEAEPADPVSAGQPEEKGERRDPVDQL